MTVEPHSRKTIVVAISDKSRVELEWILPLIDEYVAVGHPVRVFDMAPVEVADDNSYWMRALSMVLGQEPDRLVDWEPIPNAIARFLDRLRASENALIARIGALYFSPKSPLVRFTPLGRWQETYRRRAADALFENCAALFVRLIESDWQEDTGEAVLIAAARAQGVPVIGYPSVIDYEIRRRNLMTCDLVLANTAGQAAQWEKISNTRIVAATPPKFTRRWLDRLSTIQHALLGEADLPEDRKTALVILKNDNSIVWTGLDFHETASEMVERLLAADMHILVKPHPRQSKKALQVLLARIDASRYTLVDGPLIYWAQRADMVVSLFSGGVLDCLAAGRVAVLYWPMTERYRAKIASGEVTDVYIRERPEGAPTTKYREFCFEVTTPGFELPETDDTAPLLRAFQEHYPAAEDSSALRDAVAATLASGNAQCARSMA